MFLFDFFDQPLIRAADALRDQRRWEEAVDAYRRIVGRRPARAGAWRQLGHCLSELGRTDEALAAYRSADHHRPDDADTLFYIANILALRGSLQHAEQLFQRVIELEPRPDVEHAGWMQLGLCRIRTDRAQQAVAAFRTAAELRPDDPDTLFNLANALLRLGNRTEAEPLFLRVIALAPDRPELQRASRFAAYHDSEQPEWFDNVAIGTTGTCNASCVHCPTGKASTANSPRGTMPMALFRSIIDQIVDSDMPILGHICFGLFGDGLVDPLVVERARYVRERIPDAMLVVNTNGAAYDHAKHAALDAYVTGITLHCESLVAKTYDYLMQPLRAERVHVKYPQIFEDFPEKVVVSVPVSRLNADERPALRTYFTGLGAIDVDFTPMSNRLDNDVALFERLSFAPVPIRCDPRIFYNLIVDCDGLVLACCNDFAREEPVGDLSSESLADMLAGERRLAFRDKIVGGCHADIATCTRCRGDTPNSLPPIGTEPHGAA